MSGDKVTTKPFPNLNPGGRKLSGESRLLKVDTEDLYAGQPKLMSRKFLPKKEDVYNHFKAVQLENEERSKEGKYTTSLFKAAQETSKVVGSIWDKGPYPHISHQGITKRMMSMNYENKAFLKSQNKQSAVGKEKQAVFKRSYQDIFDISTKNWRKEVVLNRGVKDVKDQKKAEIDIDYLDKVMKGEDVGPLGGIDLVYKTKIEEREKRKKPKQPKNAQLEKVCVKDTTKEKEIFKEAVEDEDTTDDESEDVQKKKKPRKLIQTRHWATCSWGADAAFQDLTFFR